jgi:putative acetyltransferase
MIEHSAMTLIAHRAAAGEWGFVSADRRGHVEVPAFNSRPAIIIKIPSVSPFAKVAVTIERPDQPDVLRLIEALDAYQTALYPPESAHLLGIEKLRGPDVRFFVARRDGNAVGCAALYCRSSAAVELKRMYVVPEARGFGIARRLLSVIESHARKLGAHTLQLETGVRQHEAIQLYSSAGFQVRGPFADYPADPLSVFMEKALASHNMP